jgi:hypothetical protein
MRMSNDVIAHYFDKTGKLADWHVCLSVESWGGKRSAQRVAEKVVITDCAWEGFQGGYLRIMMDAGSILS